MRRRRSSLGSKIFTAIIIIACLSIFGYAKYWEKTHLTEECVGIVVDYAEEWQTVDEDEDLYYYPIVKFTVDGKEYESQSITGYGGKRWDIGAEARVKYNPKDPSEVDVLKLKKK